MIRDRLIYPIIVGEYFDDGHYFVADSPNIDGMVTQGNTFNEVVFWAEDAIATMLEDMTDYPEAVDPSKWELKDNEKIVYISVNMREWLSRNGKTIRKNVTVPEYLVRAAKERGLNTSQIFTNALHEELGI